MDQKEQKNLELKGLIEDSESCVAFEKRKKHHVALHPIQLHDIDSAVEEILDAKLNAYDAELNGFLLAYNNPKFLSPSGAIYGDNYYIHLDIEVDFYIFRLKLGSKLKGVVNTVGLKHIGVLVHKVFFASIPQPEEEEDWPGNNVNMGQEIIFTVDQLDLRSRIPYIQGVLHKDEYLKGCKLYNNGIVENEESIENSETTGTSDKKNKEKKIKIEHDSDEVESAVSKLKIEPCDDSHSKANL